MQFITQSEKNTALLAQKLAPIVEKKTTLNPVNMLFTGDLGAGKSVFIRSLIRALTNNPEQNVPSPTFTLVQSYDTEHFPIHHLDLYRLEEPEEIFELGWDDLQSEGLSLIEWPQRLGPYKPDNAIDISIRIAQDLQDTRHIDIQGLDTTEDFDFE